MQPADAKLSRSSLMLSLRRYSAAVRDMEQTVLIPSLLREVPSDDIAEDSAEDIDDPKDLYEHYLMLKAIRNTVKNGLLTPHDEVKVKGQTAQRKSLGPLLEGNPEALFQFHLNGLFQVMAQLTSSSQSLTAKYMDIIGLSN